MLNYGEAFRFQRESAELNKTELAKAIQTSHQNVSRWEAGTILPNIDFCVRLADFYGITLDELVGRDTTPNSTKFNTEIHDNHGNITFNQR